MPGHLDRGSGETAGHVRRLSCDGEDAGVQAIVEVGGEVGDFVGEVDQLGLEGRTKIEEIRGEFGMSGARVIARVLDDAFTHREGEVEAAPGGIALFKPGDDAECVQVVVEAEAMVAQGGIERLFAGMAKGRMTDVVGQGEGLGEFAIQAQSAARVRGNLGHFKRVGEPAAKVVAGQVAREAGEDLGFSGQATKCAGVKNAGGVAREGRAIGMRRFRMVRGQRGCRWPSTAMSGGSASFRLV